MDDKPFQRSAVIEDGFRALSNDSCDNDSSLVHTNQPKKSFIVFKIIIATVLLLFVAIAASSGTVY
jgi:hypothetical protein